MIVSASRRTDVPALYPEWLAARLGAGYVDVPHPFDPSRIRRVDLRPSPEGPMDALVLWTRNPGRLLQFLPEWERRGIRTLWLVTVTGYPACLEPEAPSASEATAAMQELSALLGADRVVWRYDPLLFCPQAGVDAGWHRDAFRRIATALAGSTRRVILSLYDDYAKARRRLREAGLAPEPLRDPVPFLADLAATGRSFAIEPQSCCEELEGAGIPAGGCIDGGLLDRLWDLGVGSRVDPGQRKGCRCAPSVDVGVYDTCTHGCLYCYATGRPETARARRESHDPARDRLA